MHGQSSLLIQSQTHTVKGAPTTTRAGQKIKRRLGRHHRGCLRRAVTGGKPDAQVARLIGQIGWQGCTTNPNHRHLSQPGASTGISQQPPQLGGHQRKQHWTPLPDWMLKAVLEKQSRLFDQSGGDPGVICAPLTGTPPRHQTAHVLKRQRIPNQS